MYDVLILGSGVAGLSAALRARRAGMSVLVLTKGDLAASATRYAQGGVAAALDEGDSPDLHLADTLIAGAGLCDPEAVRILVNEGPDRVLELEHVGAHFDTENGQRLQFAREGGHSLARVVHAGGDATGAEIERALVDAVVRYQADVHEGWFVVDLLVEHGRCRGVIARDPQGNTHNVRAVDTVLATGGAGQCFAVTTNPALSTGDGIALALRAGVACADLEFVQFHPTALHHPVMPRPLLSEALRGEGAVLRDDDGRAFMADEHPQRDLAPRDIVSRAIARRLRDTGADHVWLDTTMIDDFAQRFPTIWNACRDADLDPTSEWLPVAPAAHYMSGGVVADLDGASTLRNLWACGETADSGVHGANRLASNSLLDGLVFGARIVDAIARGKTEAEQSGAMWGVTPFDERAAPDGWAPQQRMAGERASVQGRETPPEAVRSAIQRVMTTDAGVLRERAGLDLAAKTLADLAALGDDLPPRQVASYEVVNLACVSQAIVAAALAREESRGSHTRTDFPKSRDRWLGRLVTTGRGSTEFVPLRAARSGRRR